MDSLNNPGQSAEYVQFGTLNISAGNATKATELRAVLPTEADGYTITTKEGEVIGFRQEGQIADQMFLKENDRGETIVMRAIQSSDENGIKANMEVKTAYTGDKMTMTRMEFDLNRRNLTTKHGNLYTNHKIKIEFPTDKKRATIVITYSEDLSGGANKKYQTRGYEVTDRGVYEFPLDYQTGEPRRHGRKWKLWDPGKIDNGDPTSNELWELIQYSKMLGDDLGLPVTIGTDSNMNAIGFRDFAKQILQTNFQDLNQIFSRMSLEG